MDPKNIAALIAGSVVCVVVFSALLIPIVSEATTTEKTFENVGAFYVELDPADTYTLVYSLTDEPGIIYVNGEAMTLPFNDGYTILAIDNAILRLQASDNTLQYKGNGSYITGIADLNISINEGSVTGTFRTATDVNSTSWPATTYTKCYVVSPEKQTYIMTTYNTPVNMLGDSPIFAFGQTWFSDNDWRLIKIEGTINDGVTVSILNKTTGAPIEGATVTDLTINATAISGYKDLYALTSITFNATDDTASASITYSAYIVPEKVTAELAVHPDAATLALLSVLPIIAMIGIILAVVGAFVVSRNDY